METSPSPVSRRRLLATGTGALAGVASASLAAAAQSTSPAASEARGPGEQLQGRTAVITGCARGIGRAIAVAYAAEGCDIMGIDRAGPVSAVLPYPPATPEDFAATGRLVEQNGRRWIPVTADIRDLHALRAAAERADRELGHIDILVADAGIQTFAPLLQMNDAQWHDIVDVNLTGTANTIRAFAPHMVRCKQGRIVLIASSQGRHGTRDGSSYSASKWGVIGLMKSAAMELGEHNITVNAVIPGLVDTPMTRNTTRWTEALKEVTKNPPKPPPEQMVMQAQEQKVPLHVPWLRPDDIAPVAVFLATDGAHMVSGATYDVTAGDSVHYTA